MKKFLTWFFGTAVSMAGVVGLYLAADQANLRWAFWVTIGGAFLVAVFRTYGPRMLEAIVRLRNYPRLLSRVTDLEQELEDLRSREMRLRQGMKQSFHDGVEEGRAQIAGAIQAALLDSPPKVVAIGNYNDRLALVGSDVQGVVRVGTRFTVRVKQTGEVRGVVEAREHDSNRGVIYMVCVDPLNLEFWQKLTEKARYDADPPSGIELVPYTPYGDSTSFHQLETPSQPATEE